MIIWLLTTDVYFYKLLKVLCKYIEKVKQTVKMHVYFLIKG